MSNVEHNASIAQHSRHKLNTCFAQDCEICGDDFVILKLQMQHKEIQSIDTHTSVEQYYNTGNIIDY